ncbi:hypothetical protein [Nocardia salmonicida]|uniref:hypothetical protein n=1 Tax=Nocardia salmonicida TaxID=53431 RepID=UPI003CEB242B
MGMISAIREWIDSVTAPKRAHELRQRRAAGVSTVQLVCHRDTWQVLSSLWYQGRLPAVPKDRVKALGDEMVEVTLSGPTLVSLITFTHNPGGTYTTVAVANRVYEQIAKVIDAVDPDAAPGLPIPAIVLDDKLGEKPRT